MGNALKPNDNVSYKSSWTHAFRGNGLNEKHCGQICIHGDCRSITRLVFTTACHGASCGCGDEWPFAVPVSRARSSPVPGVVAYFRPSYAAGQE